MQKKTGLAGEVFGSLVEAIGEELTDALALRFGGRSVLIPRSHKSMLAQKLCEVIGVDGFQKLIKVFAGQRIYIRKGCHHKKAARNRAICDRADFLMRSVERGGEGLSGRQAISKLVDEFGLSDRQIEIVLNRGW